MRALKSVKAANTWEERQKSINIPPQATIPKMPPVQPPKKTN